MAAGIAMAGIDMVGEAVGPAVREIHPGRGRGGMVPREETTLEHLRSMRNLSRHGCLLPLLSPLRLHRWRTRL